MAFNNLEWFDKLKLNPYMVYHRKEWHRLFSHGLVHANWSHLLFNMLTLYFFGENVEMYFKAIFGTKGTLFYTLMYVFAIAVASTRSMYLNKNNHWYNSVGASGAVSAVLFASILFNPFIGIYLFFIPIPIPGFIFGPLYLAYSHYMSKQNLDNIGHDAHFLGAVFGFVFPIICNYKIFLYFIDQLLGN